MRWWRPRAPVEPMYMPGRLRTASSPSSTVMSRAPYVEEPALRLPRAPPFEGFLAKPSLPICLHEKPRRRDAEHTGQGGTNQVLNTSSLALLPDATRRHKIPANRAKKDAETRSCF